MIMQPDSPVGHQTIYCPYCKQTLSVTYNVLSREKYYCVLCNHTFDIDDIERDE